MSVRHESRGIPTFPERWSPNDREWVWVSWEDFLGDESFTSTWILPADWTNHSEQAAQTITDPAGTEYGNANGVLLSTTAAPGTYTITNRVTIGSGETQRVYDRSVNIVVAGQ